MIKILTLPRLPPALEGKMEELIGSLWCDVYGKTKKEKEEADTYEMYKDMWMKRIEE